METHLNKQTMIQANELRIGNFIEVNGKGEKIWALDLDLQDESWPLFSAGKHSNVGIREFKESDLKYIQLTEEWLIRFGFEGPKNEAGKYYELNRHRVYIFKDSFEFEFNYRDEERINLFRSFQYVHNLQNLYFALTGQELKLNEK